MSGTFFNEFQSLNPKSNFKGFIKHCPEDTRGSHVWSTISSITWRHMHAETGLVHFFLFEIFDPIINFLRIRRFGPYSNYSNMQVWSTSKEKVDQTCEFELIWCHVITNYSNLQVRSTFFCSKWTKPAYSKKINHVIKNFEEKKSGPNLFRHAYAVTWWRR